ncbi:MAG: hypothetical protein PHU25_19195 [Deltaproteobacteria bacterium]|nr:hypothetical protein [Deltaproteobacteria bacterium]
MTRARASSRDEAQPGLAIGLQTGLQTTSLADDAMARSLLLVSVHVWNADDDRLVRPKEGGGCRCE